MAIHIFWGDDDYLITRNLNHLKSQLVNPAWEAFNFRQYPSDKEDINSMITDLITPPFGDGSRLIVLLYPQWLREVDKAIVELFNKTIPQIPATNHLLITLNKKPDTRFKSVKLLLKSAQVREFSLISPWQTEELKRRVISTANSLHLSVTEAAALYLAKSLGNNTRLLFNELEKLACYTNSNPIDIEQAEALVSSTTENSLVLAKAILAGDSSLSVKIAQKLSLDNEPPLRIISTLTTMFRHWLWVKMLVEQGISEHRAIASQIGIPNPHRVFYLKQEVNTVSRDKLTIILVQLLHLEIDLKTGNNSLIPSIIKLSQM